MVMGFLVMGSVMVPTMTGPALMNKTVLLLRTPSLELGWILVVHDLMNRIG